MVTQLSTVTYVYAGDKHLNNQTVQDLIARAQQLVPQAQRIELDAAQSSIYDFREATSPTLLSDSAIVILSNMAQASTELVKEISSYITTPHEEQSYIICQQLEANAKKVKDTLQAAGAQIITVQDLSKERDLVEYVISCFAARKRMITRNAAQFMASVLTGQADQIQALSNQLCDDFDTDPIDIDVVQQYTTAAPQVKGFAIADMALAGNGAAAVVQLRQALIQGTDPLAIIGALASSLRTMAKTAAAQAGLISSREVGPSWLMNKARKQLSGWNTPAMAKCFELLAQADAVAKGTPGDTQYALEQAVMAIATRGNQNV